MSAIPDDGGGERGGKGDAVGPEEISPDFTLHRRATRRAVEREWEQGTCQLVYGHVRGFGREFGVLGCGKAK